MRKQGVVLKHRVYVSVKRRERGHVFAVQRNGARRRQIEAGDHPEKGGLARTRRTEQTKELAVHDVEVHTVHRMHRVVARSKRLANAANLNR